MSGSSGAAKKLSPKRTALNLCKITLRVLLLLLLFISQHCVIHDVICTQTLDIRRLTSRCLTVITLSKHFPFTNLNIFTQKCIKPEFCFSKKTLVSCVRKEKEREGRVFV